MIGSYEEALSFLSAKLPMFSRQGINAIKPGLENILKLCELLNNPQEKLKTIHIAGTNGKGSVSHILSAAFQKSGYKTGLYTSPHLIDLCERFKINGVNAPQSFIISFLNKTEQIINEIAPSYFEVNVAMAFEYFANENVDIAIIETGLGGRLDSTNIIHPELSVITNIGYDHTQILGDTLEKIAAEKAGIIKEGVPVVIGETQPETEQVFFLASHNKKAPIYFADSIWDLVRQQPLTDEFQYFTAINKAEQITLPIQTDLMGSYQLKNIRTACMAVDILQQKGWKVTRENLVLGLPNIKSITGLKGRWEKINTHPTIILDVGHNAPGLEYLKENLQLSQNSDSGQLYILTGFVKDKDVQNILPYFPVQAQFIFTQSNVPRALSADELKSMAEIYGLKGEPFSSVPLAIEAILPNLSHKDTLLITGSCFIVGEALAYFQENKNSLPTQINTD